MNREIAGAGIEQHRAVEAFVGRGRRAPELGADPARRDHGRDAVVGRLHHAADRLRTEAQGGRPADDLDLVGGERIDRHEMVLAQVGRAIGADAVFLDAHAIDVEAANDRPAGGAGRKARAGDAGLCRTAGRRASPAPLRRMSSLGTTVTVAN